MIVHEYIGKTPVKEIIAATTQRNQVTIPAEVRRLLGLKPRDKVAFIVDDHGAVGLTAAPFTLESVFRSVSPAVPVDDLETLIRDAKDEKAERTARELRGE